MMYEKNEIEELAPWIAVVITLIGGVLRVLMLGAKGLWLDEAFSMWLASHNVANMLHLIVQIDQHPPLYYLLLHYWMAFNGNTPSDLRMLSALFGTATIPVVYLIGKRLSGWMVGLAAALLLAISPFDIRYAQEARMFTLLMFNASVAMYALVWLLTDPRSSAPIGSQFRHYLHTWLTAGPPEPDSGENFSYEDKNRHRTRLTVWISRHRWLPIHAIETDLAWVALIVFSAATMLSHNTAVLFPIATNVFVLGLMLFQRLKSSETVSTFKVPSITNWVKAQVGIFLLWSPWIVAFIRQASRVYQEFWIPMPSWSTVAQALRSFLNEPLPGQTSQVVVWIVYTAVLCLGLLYYRKEMAKFLFMAALFAVPFLGELAVSIQRPVFLDRTLIWTTIPLFLLLAAGIAQFRFRLLIILMLGVVSTFNLFATGDYFRFVQKEDWSGPAGFVANFAKKDDLVLFNTTSAQIPFDYYFKPYEDLYDIQVEKHGAPVDMFDSGVLEPKMTESDIPRLLSLLSAHKQVWLVYSHNSNTDPLGLIPQTLASQLTLIYTRDYNGVQIQWYIAP
jgi:mannosyltransferase